MPTDKALIKYTLDVLANMHGNSLVTDTLAAEVELRAGRPLTTNQVRDVLTFCRDRGWIDTRRNDFREDTWWISDAGLNKSAGM